MVENHLCRLASDAQASQLGSHRVPDSMKIGILLADIQPLTDGGEGMARGIAMKRGALFHGRREYKYGVLAGSFQRSCKYHGSQRRERDDVRLIVLVRLPGIRQIGLFEPKVSSCRIAPTSSASRWPVRKPSRTIAPICAAVSIAAAEPRCVQIARISSGL
jgi:hypothetical protein